MKSLIANICILGMIGMAIGAGVFAADTADVNATVKVQNISVSVSDGTVDYQTLALSGTEDTTTSGVDNSQTATNDGNVTEDFNIKGADVSTGCSWTLATTQGDEQYFHKFCTSDCDSSPTWTALTTSYQTLAAGVAESGNQVFDLQIGVPSSTTCTAQATATVTVQAVLPGS